MFAVVSCEIHSLLDADPGDQLCIDFLVTYIICGCIAVVLICISVVVLCGCCWVDKIATERAEKKFGDETDMGATKQLNGVDETMSIQQTHSLPDLRSAQVLARSYPPLFAVRDSTTDMQLTA